MSIEIYNKITYDTENKLSYIYIDEGENVARTEEITESILFDYDKDNNLVGIELLGISLKQ